MVGASTLACTKWFGAVAGIVHVMVTPSRSGDRTVKPPCWIQNRINGREVYRAAVAGTKSYGLYVFRPAVGARQSFPFSGGNADSVDIAAAGRL